MKDTGPCPILLNAIKCRLSEATTDRLCTIGFDAMSLTPALRYFEHCDRVVGFEDVGAPGRSTKVANQGLVCVLRGIEGKWKLPIGYFLIRDNPSQDRFRHIIFNCLRAVAEAGADVRVLTCDQERTQWACLKKAEVSKEKPYIFHPFTGRPVYVVPDPAHCLKNLRNALRTHDILYAPGRFAR